MIRGLAALAVAAGHIRTLLFVDQTHLLNLNFVDSTFLFFTDLQHQAVIIFFVLSGFFVGGKVLSDFSQNRWSWLHYSTQRLTRLWTVLVPALLLTLLLDTIGRSLGFHRDFAGARDGWGCFFGNLFFLQTIFCDVYGTNGPLWSLANEFWYYLLFPLIYFSVFTKSPSKAKIPCLLLVILSLFFLPKNMIALSLVWLMGLGAFIFSTQSTFNRVTGRGLFFMGALLLFLFSLFYSHKTSTLYADDLIGLSFACLFPFMTSHTIRFIWYEKIATTISNMSYTLYLVHFPVLFFTFTVFKIPRLQQLSWEGYLVFGSILLAVFAFSWGMWFLFERHTAQIRQVCNQTLLPRFRRLMSRWSGQ